MAFGIGIPMGADAGQIRGKQKSIACDCWFSAGGNTIPRFIKYQDEEGSIHGIGSIQVISSEDKRYCGVRTKEYKCKTEKNGVEYLFTLYFNQEECTWKMVYESLL